MIILRQKEFGLFGKFKSWAEDYNYRHGFGPRAEKERLEKKQQEENLRKKIERDKQEKEYQSLSKTHAKLLKIWKNVKPLEPKWGDGDEYPTLNLNIGYTQNVGGFCLGWQNEPWYEWENNHWVETNYYGKPRIIPNLKQDILKFLNTEIKEWKTIHIKYLEKEDVDEVLIYLEALKSEVTKNL